MEFTAQQIASFLNGKIEGDPNVKVSKIAKIEEATEGSLAFLSNPLYTKYIYETNASIVLVKENFKPEHSVKSTLIKVKDPYMALAKLLKIVENLSKKQRKGISKTAIISETVKFSDKESVFIGDYVVIENNVEIGKNVQIYPHVYIGENCKIGDNTILYSGAKLYSDSIIGNHCIIHSGVVIGSDGFGFVADEDGNYVKIPQLGNVIIEDDVEIFPNTTIDRGSLGATIIRKGVKLDNLVMVAHNCEIGRNTVVAAQAGFAGSSKVGENCLIGGQVGVAGHLKIGNNVQIAAQSGVGSDVESNSQIMGSPAFDANKYKRCFVHFKNFEQIVEQINNIENELKNLKK